MTGSAHIQQISESPSVGAVIIGTFIVGRIFALIAYISGDQFFILRSVLPFGSYVYFISGQYFYSAVLSAENNVIMSDLTFFVSLSIFLLNVCIRTV